jgi:hypothetical protein
MQSMCTRTSYRRQVALRRSCVFLQRRGIECFPSRSAYLSRRYTQPDHNTLRNQVFLQKTSIIRRPLSVCGFREHTLLISTICDTPMICVEHQELGIYVS